MSARDVTPERQPHTEKASGVLLDSEAPRHAVPPDSDAVAASAGSDAGSDASDASRQFSVVERFRLSKRADGSGALVPVPASSSPHRAAKPTLPQSRVVIRSEDETIRSLIEVWVNSPDWDLYRPRTKRTHVKSLRVIDRVWGHVTLAHFDNPLIYSALRGWQGTLTHKPAAADNYFNVLCALLKFGVLRKKLAYNHATGIPDLYDIGRRAAIVWTIEEVELAVSTADELGLPTVGDAILLAFETGMRPQDLITACIDHVRPYEFTKRALKASRFGNRYFATIPRTEELDLVITRCANRSREHGVDTLLVTNEGLPFRDFQLENAVRTVRDTCGIRHLDPLTGKRDEKHLHDLRGTFATRLLATTDLTDQEVAEVMAWSPRWVARIRRVYVDDVTHLQAMGKRWQSQALASNSVVEA